MISYVQLKVLQICAKCHGLEKYAKVDFFGDEYFKAYIFYNIFIPWHSFDM